MQEMQRDQQGFAQQHCRVTEGALEDIAPVMLSGQSALMLVAPEPEPVVQLVGWGQESNCHIEIHAPGHSAACDLPDIRRACCDVLTDGIQCHGQGQSCMQSRMMSMPQGELQFFQSHQGAQDACPNLVATMQEMQRDQQGFAQQHCRVTEGALEEIIPIMLSGQSALMMVAPEPKQEVQNFILPGMIGFAVGAAVVTSVVAFKKKRSSGDLYVPLAEETA